MKIKSLFLGLCVVLCSSVFASNQHIHPNATDADKKPSEKNLTWPGYCEIEIINNSFDDVRVSGVFDDGTSLLPFTIYSFESPHYVSLFYYGYCHAGMNLYISSWSGYLIYANYTPVSSTIRVVPYLKNQLKAEVTAK